MQRSFHPTYLYYRTCSHNIQLDFGRISVLLFLCSAQTEDRIRFDSILDVAGRLPPVLLGVPLVLPALRIAFLVRRAAVLLGMPGTLSGFLPDIASGTALLSLLRRP
jgi:hypothetical protein